MGPAETGRESPGAARPVGAESTVALPGDERVIGFDVARSIALLGMILVHFPQAAEEITGRSRLAILATILDGRAAALFVVLAGVGITLLSRKAVAAGGAALTAVRRMLILRGIFLLVVGFLNLVIWPGDILRVYGVSLILASALLRARNRTLLALAAECALIFIFLFLNVEFDANWEWDELEYRDLWKPVNVIRNLFYDGFRSVFPWMGFILYGMWLGRLDLAERRTNNRVLLTALAVAVVTEVISYVIVATLSAGPDETLDEDQQDQIVALFGTGSMPALPMFLLAVGGEVTAIIALCVRLTIAWPGRFWQPFVATGQMALTWYIAHIVIGLGTLEALGLVGEISIRATVACGLVFFAAAVLISWGWKTRFRRGPLEWVMRSITG